MEFSALKHTHSALSLLLKSSMKYRWILLLALLPNVIFGSAIFFIFMFNAQSTVKVISKQNTSHQITSLIHCSDVSVTLGLKRAQKKWSWMNSEGRIKRLNPCWCKATLYPSPDLKKQNLWNLIALHSQNRGPCPWFLQYHMEWRVIKKPKQRKTGWGAQKLQLSYQWLV